MDTGGSVMRDVAQTRLVCPAIPRSYRKGPTMSLHVTAVTVHHCVATRHCRHCRSLRVTTSIPFSTAGSLTASQAPGSKCRPLELLKPVLERRDGQCLMGDI